MKPLLKELLSHCAPISESVVEHFLNRLPEAYFALFNIQDQVRHLQLLAQVSPEVPMHVLISSLSEKEYECTFIGFDYPGVFSYITGILSSLGLDIQQGHVFTYQEPESLHLDRHFITRNKAQLTELSIIRRKKIIDTFRVHLAKEWVFKEWEQTLILRMSEIAQSLEQGDGESFQVAKEQVNRWVVGRLTELRRFQSKPLTPMNVEVDESCKEATRLVITSQDTPAFLYALSTALSAQNVQMNQIQIKTLDAKVEDVIDVVDNEGKAIVDKDRIGRLLLSVMLIKPFTYFLVQAPDSYRALFRFEQFVAHLVSMGGSQEWHTLWNDPKWLQDMAKLLGTSDYLWEDMIRLNYESVLPLMAPSYDQDKTYDPLLMKQRLDSFLVQKTDKESFKKALNDFKDHELFLIDLNYILGKSDFNELSTHLTALAELVLKKALQWAFDEEEKKWGVPQSVAGLKAKYTLLGLGKLGEKSLGYASDIELMLVYSDSGETNGMNKVSNGTFFEHVVKDIVDTISAKRDGIFQIDLRLRPYGNDGPTAVSLESFCNYFDFTGSAHVVEKMALVRLRAIAGDESLGHQIERLRDQYVYFSSLKLDTVWELRKKQFLEKTKKGVLNAKFSPGALVDIEYTVQSLQILYGAKYTKLRTPELLKAIEALSQVGVLEPDIYRQLVGAYHFFRKLINALRMLRGSALDLDLPAFQSDDFGHLARRMGFHSKSHLSASEKLHWDFEVQTAFVRLFVQKYFSRESLANPSIGNVADILLVEETEAFNRTILEQYGFTDTYKAWINCKGLLAACRKKDLFVKLAVLAFDWLSQKSDPDRALNNWERFVSNMNPDQVDHHYQLLFRQPARLQILLDIFSTSQFLSDTLIRNTHYFEWMTSFNMLYSEAKRNRLDDDLITFENFAELDWMNAMRTYKRREMLRIAVRDFSLGVSLKYIVRELSLLAEIMVQYCLNFALNQLKQSWGEAKVSLFENNICILALGKLGGEELNYSSDIDLVAFYSDDLLLFLSKEEIASGLSQLLTLLTRYVSEYTEEGCLYRLDWALRPFGSSGDWGFSKQGLLNYYAHSASLWELQALLKARPLAGSFWLGFELLENLEPLMSQIDTVKIQKSIVHLRKIAVKKSRIQNKLDIKNGEGGLRDIEFLVQALQLKELRQHRSLFKRATVPALTELMRCDILTQAQGNELRENYVLLRRIEHFLQILEDQQTHSLPLDKSELDILAKKLLGKKANFEQLLANLKQRMIRNRELFNSFLL